MKQNEIMENIAEQFGFKADKYYSAKDKINRCHNELIVGIKSMIGGGI